MKKLLFALTVCLLLPALSWASDYNSISQDAMKQRLESHDPMTIVDICPLEMFAAGHIPGSIETNAYPVKTDEERAKLHAILPQLTANADDVVIVCPGGAGGAQRTYDYYKANGIDEKRLLILEKGMKGWPYQKEAK